MPPIVPLGTGLANKTILGHPVGLYILFFTEMWERFSYYGMRALLMTYMVTYFRWSQDEASSIYKWYTSLVYVTPIIGGFLADRYLGNRWAVIIGAILMAIGHFLMAFEASSIFFAALVFLIVGNGFFKPNMTTQVGRLYPPTTEGGMVPTQSFTWGSILARLWHPLPVVGSKRTPRVVFMRALPLLGWE